jgi:hypothetical protein
VPAAKSDFYFFVDAVADGLYDFGFDYVALRVDSHFNHYIASQVTGQRGSFHWGIGVDYWIGYVDFVAGNGPVDHRSEWRSGLGIAICGVGIIYYWLTVEITFSQLRTRLRLG